MAKTNKKLSEKAKKSASLRHNWGLQWCWNYERMQASGFAWAMVPVIEELYDDNEERCRHLERHMRFYNSHPGASAIIGGAAVALEESYQPDMSDSIKVALMGPMAGIGDTIQAVLVQPLAFIIGASLAAEGNYLGVLVVVASMLLLWAARFPLFKWGYNRSVNIIEDISGNSDFNSMRDAAGILGLVVVGGFVPSMIGLRVAYQYVQSMTDEVTGNVATRTVSIQETLDRILPFMVPIIMVGFCYWMIKVKRVSPIRAILILAGITFVLGALGIVA
jgi:PTS system mannose-specific IID component